MGSPKKPAQGVRREPGPDTLPALRDMLIQDPRIGRLGVHHNGNGSSARPDDTAPTEIQHAPSIAPVTPYIEPKPQQANLQSDGIASDRPSVAKRAFRSVALGFVVIAMGGAAFALLSYEGDKKQDVVRAWDLSLNWVSSVLHANSSQGAKGSDVAAESISQPLDKAPSQNTAVLPATPGLAVAPASVAVGSSSELQYQFKSVASDVADLRRLIDQLGGRVDRLAARVDQLLAKQDQMERDIATVQAAQQNISQKIASLSQPTTVRIPRKKVVRTAPPVAAYPSPLGVNDYPHR